MNRVLASLLLIAIGVLLGVAATQFMSEPIRDQQLHNAEGEPEILYWVAPMDPSYRRDGPGKSPMDMDLVPVYARQGEATGDDAVRIEASVVNNLGVETRVVERKVLREKIRTVGRVEYNDERVAHVHLRASGWIQRLAVRAEGERVRRGDLLFEVYSPDLVKAQAEFIQTLKSGRQELIAVTRDRLRALAIPKSLIDALERNGKVQQNVRVFAPSSGVVAQLNVADGKFVKPDSDIMVIAELDQLWLISDVFESHADLVEVGARVTAGTAFAPGERITTQVDYIYPNLDPITRTVPVRAVIENKDGKLKPGMFMTVSIDAAARPPALLIPSTALIRTGTDERVIVAYGDGRFRPAAVESGAEADGMIEIVAGLAEGELVVVSGQFLIDSESSIAGASLRLSAGSGSEVNVSGGHEHARDDAKGDDPPIGFESREASP